MAGEQAPGNTSGDAFPDADQFLSATVGEIPRLPQPVAKPDRILRAASLGTLFGVVDFIISHIVHPYSASRADDRSELFAVAAGVLLGSVSEIKHLCSETPQAKAARRGNICTAGASGATLGVGVASLGHAALLSPFDFGITFGATVLFLGAAACNNYIKKAKFCDKCGAKGICSQKVCRRCFHLFFPKTGPIDCAVTKVIDWYTIASFLQQQRLSYLDSEVLVRKHIRDWKWKKTPEGFLVYCDSFVNWVSKNQSIMLDFIGAGKAGRSDKDISDDLSTRGL